MKKLIGRTDIEDALKRLDKLTQEEARMATAQVLKATHSVDDRVREVADNVDQVKRLSYSNLIRSGCGASCVLSGNQLWDSLHKWLSPPDPSTNHNIACGTHQKITANWFFQGGMFTGWKSTSSLLWIHGKRACHVAGRLLSCLIPSDNVLCSQPALARAFSGPSIFGDFSIEILNPSLSSTIIQDIEVMCKAGQASIAYFYFDFRDINKQSLNHLVPSLLSQLSASSDARCDILLRLYSDHERGNKQPSDIVLAECLKQIITLPSQRQIYLIMDAVDECPNSSGIPTPRERVLRLIQELLELRLSHLHICVTSRPEIDIRDILDPLTSLKVSLHDQTGQKEDIADYIKSVVYSDSEPIMKRWRLEDKELVIETLSERADGM